MPKRDILVYARQLRRPIFTTHELSAGSGKSPSATTQALNCLRRQGLVLKVYRGIWAEKGRDELSPYSVIPFLFPRHRAYVSFISALHLHGIIEQIPQVITIASTSHTKTMHTAIGTFSVHRIAPSFFKGFDWYKKEGNFLIAEPEKALVDSLYLSARKKRQFGHFPELHFPEDFSVSKAKSWARSIADANIRHNVQKKLAVILR
jgi:predicted transcriptional regulator of viral defense system